MRNSITFSYYFANKNGRPVLPVHTLFKGEEKTYYLSYFRDCAFQVSMTPEGEGDCGSSNRIPAEVAANEEVLFAFATEALTRFGSNAYSDLRFSFTLEKSMQLIDFIRAVIKD